MKRALKDFFTTNFIKALFTALGLSLGLSGVIAAAATAPAAAPDDEVHRREIGAVRPDHRRACGVGGSFPSPLVGGGGSIARSAIETGEGSVSADRDPSS